MDVSPIWSLALGCGETSWWVGAQRFWTLGTWQELGSKPTTKPPTEDGLGLSYSRLSELRLRFFRLSQQTRPSQKQKEQRTPVRSPPKPAHPRLTFGTQALTPESAPKPRHKAPKRPPDAPSSGPFEGSLARKSIAPQTERLNVTSAAYYCGRLRHPFRTT